MGSFSIKNAKNPLPLRSEPREARYLGLLKGSLRRAVVGTSFSERKKDSV